MTNIPRRDVTEYAPATVPVSDVGRLLIRCPDRSGIVAAVTTFLANAGANIISLDQYSTERVGGKFFQRTVFHLPGLVAAREKPGTGVRRRGGRPIGYGIHPDGGGET